ncbi:ubiquitin carboxyl-terminal hydrolase 1 [Scaptodrosophila lebanonensis]|uniref:Ubiquitin carboxyl-terminal hydrolase 1 n=1 Tax=Drosophila lebanonensis TaxID=7225 RepID=A0A6J2T1D6_DROLE|nr:ubiquitin carboxyl-terminal hydrolase 1 [Scaptodrosophila lebanonensis]XP_030370716.1 ubiquitin carboxyl-terminal hydrolase 1 [Scaptodrosophila lebanonensis]
MHEYDVTELKEELDSLPVNENYNYIQTKTLPPRPARQLEASINSESHKKDIKTNSIQQFDDIIIISDTDSEQKDDKDSEKSSSAYKAIYPVVEEYTDQLPIAHLPSKEEAPKNAAAAVEGEEEVEKASPTKRKRTRRVYVAEESRCASLRSRKPPQTEATDITEQTSKAKLTRQTTPSPTPSESKEQKYIQSEQFKPEFWNLIDTLEEPEPKPSRKRARVFGGRQKRKRTAIPPLDTVYSPETAAAIKAAQLELESQKPIGRSARKRTATMSLYDRRYQTTDERRVGNGYNNSNSLRSGTMTDADTQDITSSSHQYYVPSGGNSASGSNAGQNGAVATLSHAPAMGTLCNIGNTCYLNSVVYTLRFAPHFLHNLHHLIQDLNVVQHTISRQHNAKSASLGRGVSGAHLENARSWSIKDLVNSNNTNNALEPYNNSNGSVSGQTNCNTVLSKSSHQSVTEKLHELYHSLHGNEMAESTEPYHADTLLHAIQDVNATFEGNQQQDAHEFLMCVLNCIRETNQSLIKAIAECPDVIANGYIANPDETDSNDMQDRMDSSTALALNSGGNGSLPTSHSTSTKTSFFSRKSKRKDEVKSSKSTRLQSPLKDNLSPTANSLTSAPASNSLFYLNTVDLSGLGGAGATSIPTPPAPSLPAKYSSDDEVNTVSLLKDKMRLEERIRELNLNFFSSDFEGVVVLTTKCLSCETITRQKQGMLDISVPVPISGYDNAEFNDKPSAYIQNSCITREYFRGDNKYSCNQCTGYTEAIRSVSYEVLPRLLVIQLNRFSGGMEKVSTYVPTAFTLECFCAKCCERSEGDKLHVYKLYSVITHVGATLTVGHYIAYTCFLDLASEYVNCPKDRRNNTPGQQQQQQHQQQPANENMAPNNGSSGSSSISTPVSTAASVLASSGTSLMKKMKFGRSKASSSGDMSKNVKQLNGITSKTITNGIGKLSMNTTCHGVNCCAMRLCCGQQQHQQPNAGSNSASSSDFSEESLQNGTNSNLNYGNNAYPPGYGSTGRGGAKANYTCPTADPLWYMCDDDKIKVMSQREFEELLSATRKITITPYLLFYVRFDTHADAGRQGSSSTPPPPPSSSSSGTPQSSWSNDNLHKM